MEVNKILLPSQSSTEQGKVFFLTCEMERRLEGQLYVYVQYKIRPAVLHHFACTRPPIAEQSQAVSCKLCKTEFWVWEMHMACHQGITDRSYSFYHSTAHDLKYKPVFILWDIKNLVPINIVGCLFLQDIWESSLCTSSWQNFVPLLRFRWLRLLESTATFTKLSQRAQFLHMEETVWRNVLYDKFEI